MGLHRTQHLGRTALSHPVSTGLQHRRLGALTGELAHGWMASDADAGYRGLARLFPDQVQAPPLKPKKDAPPETLAAWDAARHQQSSERIRVEHANAEHKQ